MLLLLSLAETMPTPPEPSFDFSWLFIKVILAMIVVCAGAYFGIKYLLPRASFIKRSQNSRIEILERFSLEPKKNLYLLKVSTKVILIGTTETTISSLLEWGAKEFESETKNI